MFDAPAQTADARALRDKLLEAAARKFQRRSPDDIAARSIRQDRARDNIEEMIGARRERGLVVEPNHRSNQPEQVSPIDVGPRHARLLSADKEPCARCAHHDARSMKCGVRVLDGGHHRSHNAAMAVCTRDGFAQPRHESFVGRAGSFEVICTRGQLVKARTKQGLQQRFPSREVTVQRAEPDASSAGDLAQRCVRTLLGYDDARDFEQAVVVLSGVCSHSTSLTNGAMLRIFGAPLR